MIPLVIHIPHSSTAIPGDVRDMLLPDDQRIERNLLAFTDWMTDDLFGHPGFRKVVYPVSRMVCDPERFRDDADEPMAARGIGAVYENDAFMKPLRNVTPEMRESLLKKYYDSHHSALEKAVEETLAEHGSCLLVDAHSFSPTPLLYEPEKDVDRPDVCIGTDRVHTPGWLADMAVNCFLRRSFSVGLNNPYSGVLVPGRFAGDPRLMAVMVEVNRRTYMASDAFRRTSFYGWMKDSVHGFLEKLNGVSLCLSR